MKGIFLLLVGCLIFSGTLLAQENIPPVDKSPMDVSYCPANYPLLKAQDKTKEAAIARVIYSRPSKNGRTIFGELIEYGKLWRVGANEATEIEFFQDAVCNKVKIKKGRYTLYAIPYADKWTLIINKDTDTWGAFRYNDANDVVRLDVPVVNTEMENDIFSVFFDKQNKDINLIITWDHVKVSVPFTLP